MSSADTFRRAGKKPTPYEDQSNNCVVYKKRRLYYGREFAGDKKRIGMGKRQDR